MTRGIDRSRVAVRWVAALLAGTCLSSPAWATDFNVNSDATLRAAITSAGSGDRIVFTGNITLAADLPAVQSNVTIVGNGNSLSGNNQFRGLFIGAFSGATQVPVTVAVQDLTITNTRARGGTGGQRAGGGAGLGGAIFVANQATLTVSNVNLTNNAAVGGNGGVAASGLGGGGGMGGNGGTQVGGGGGLGAGATGGNNNTSGQGGIATGASSGGAAGSPGATGVGANGGGGGGNNSGGAPPQGAAGGGGVGGGAGGGVGGAGGAGGFGGGGGSASASGGAGGKGGFGGGGAGSGGLGATAGAGGFGGGGGSGSGAGAGGFGGGNGTTGVAGGGGGAGMGGAIFVQQGGNLTLGGALTISGNSVTAGSGITGGGNGSAFGTGIFLQGNGTVNFAPGAGQTQTMSNAIADQTGSGGTGANAGSYGLVMNGAGTLVLSVANAYSGGTTVGGGGLINFAAANNFGSGAITLNGGGLQWATGNTLDISSRLAALGAGGGTFDTNGNNVTFATGLGGSGGLTKQGNGTLTLASASNSYGGATLVNMGTLQAGVTNAFSSSSAFTVASGAVLDLNNFNQAIGSLAGAGAVTLGAATLTTGNDNTSTTFSGAISGTGGLTKVGGGILTLASANTYSGGTTVSGGLINFNALNNFGTGPITLAGGGLQWAAGTTTDISSRLAPLGAAGATFDTNGNSVTFASGLGGTGGLNKQGAGLLNLAAANTYTGGTVVTAGTLAVNGSVVGNVAVGAAGTLGGNGTIGGSVATVGTVAPGNSIGTLAVSGNFAQQGGVYQVEANAQGQADRINVGGTAAIQGNSTVQVLAQPGNYGLSTTYTILRATGGVAGTYSGVSSNFAFLTPSLSYDANDVFLTLTLNSFDFGGRTYNQRQVGRTLDQTIGSASGDYATVLGAIIGLSTANGPQTLDMISGQQYAGFQNAMVQGAQLFMSNFANRAGSASGRGTKIALAEACDVACDTTTPGVWGAWGGAVGGTGTIAGNDNAGTFTYSVGGFSGGLDRKFGDNFLAGVTVGYQTGGQWTGGFDGRSITDAVQAGLYGGFVQGPVYVDALAAYAYNANQMWRPINIPGLQPRTAYGQAGANQFLGQLEAGYRFDLGGAPGYFVTPFALLQGSTATQNGFTETGAQSLNLNVTQQTSGSLRSILGAQLGAAMDLGLRDRIAAQLRLGWSHEYADTARPVTASFVGAPAVPFTVFGAAPTRDGAVVGFSVSTAIAEAMGVYVRYEGTIAGQDSSHALTAGLRMTW
jgi:autotransporter-associated beta strand protein